MRNIQVFGVLVSLLTSFLLFDEREGEKEEKSAGARMQTPVTPPPRALCKRREIDVIRELWLKNYIALISAWRQGDYLKLRFCTIIGAATKRIYIAWPRKLIIFSLGVGQRTGVELIERQKESKVLFKFEITRPSIRRMRGIVDFDAGG